MAVAMIRFCFAQVRMECVCADKDEGCKTLARTALAKTTALNMSVISSNEAPTGAPTKAQSKVADGGACMKGADCASGTCNQMSNRHSGKGECVAGKTAPPTAPGTAPASESSNAPDLCPRFSAQRLAAPATHTVSSPCAGSSSSPAPRASASQARNQITPPGQRPPPRAAAATAPPTRFSRGPAARRRIARR